MPEVPSFKRDIKIPDKLKPDEDNIVNDVGEAQLHYNWLEHIADLQGIDFKKAKILELGSGKALFLQYAKNNGINAIGVDIEPRGDFKGSQVIARIEQLPFPDESFDIIYSSFVFDSGVYDQDQSLMMKEAHRVLKKDGIYVTVEMHASLNEHYFKLIESLLPTRIWRKK